MRHRAPLTVPLVTQAHSPGRLLRQRHHHERHRDDKLPTAMASTRARREHAVILWGGGRGYMPKGNSGLGLGGVRDGSANGSAFCSEVLCPASSRSPMRLLTCAGGRQCRPRPSEYIPGGQGVAGSNPAVPTGSRTLVPRIGNENCHDRSHRTGWDEQSIQGGGRAIPADTTTETNADHLPPPAPSYSVTERSQHEQ